MKIILASASPRRQELLKNIFSDFITAKSNSEEKALFHTPEQYVMDLALQKVLDVSHQPFPVNESQNPLPSQKNSKNDDYLLIGADTIVFHRGKVLGKPENKEAAFSMLKDLAADTHEVYTGVALYRHLSTKECIRRFYSCTKVRVNPLSDEEISAYIATNDCYDKAGGYGIQGTFSKHIASIEGDYYNVVGLPISQLYEEIKQIVHI